jgi:hypothetical protein
MTTLMTIDRFDAAPPLYMDAVTRILRGMAALAGAPSSTNGWAAVVLGAFDYLAFKRRLSFAGLDQLLQLGPLKQRLELLKSIFALDPSTDGDSGGGGDQIQPPDYASGSVTTIDMSCPFVDVHTACVMLKIGIDLLMKAECAGGK